MQEGLQSHQSYDDSLAVKALYLLIYMLLMETNITQIAFRISHFEEVA